MLLAGKSAAIFGFASTKSIAWAVAERLSQSGMTLSIGIASERFRPSLEKATSSWEKKPHIVVCDAKEDESITEAWKLISAEHGEKLDAMVHSIAYATAHSMKSPFIETTKEDFQTAFEISVYSFISHAREAAPLLKANGGGTMLSMSYIGSQRVVPNYRVMGPAKAALEATSRQLAVELGRDRIRVNCISAGPIDTLAARGIAGFSELREESRANSPLPGGVDASHVADLSEFLISDRARAITGQTLYVDAGVSALL